MTKDHGCNPSDNLSEESDQNSYSKTFGNKVYGLFYVVGFLLYLIYFVLLVFDQNFIYTDILPNISIFILAVGFSLWATPVVVKIREIYIIKIIFGFFYAAIAILAIIPARDLTAHVLSLPPQDFDLTVAILGLIFYIFIWAHAALIFLPIFVIISLLFTLLSTPVSVIAKLSIRHEAKGKDLDNLRLRTFLHCVGALGVAAILWEIVEWDYKSNVLIDEAVRSIAYYADFHEINNHPGLTSDMRMHIHSNSVVSYMNKDNLHIETVTFDYSK